MPHLTDEQATFELTVPGLSDHPMTLRDFAVEDPSTLVAGAEEIEIGCGGGGLSVGCYTGPVKQHLWITPGSQAARLLEAWLELQTEHPGTLHADAVITILASGAGYQCSRGKLSRLSESEYEVSWRGISAPDQI